MTKNEAKSEERPEVYAVKHESADWQFSRREFLAASSAAAVAALSAGCGPAGKMGKVCSNSRAHKTEIHQVAFSPDGSMLLSDEMTANASVKLWALPEGRLVKSLPAAITSYAYVFSPNGAYVAYYPKADETIYLNAVLSEGDSIPLKGHTHYVDALSFCPDGSMLASAGFDETIRLWSLPGGELLKTIEVECDIIQSLEISPDSRLLAAKVDYKRILLYTLPQGDFLAALEGHEEEIYPTRILFSPDMNILATGSHDDTIKLWSLPDGELLETLGGFEKMVYMGFTPDSKRLVAGNGAGMLRLYSLPDGALVKTLVEDGFVAAFAISPDGRLLAANASGEGASSDWTMWSLPDGERLLDSDGDIDGGIKEILFTPDGASLITCGYSGDVLNVWSASTGKLLKTLDGRQDDISAMALSADGSMLAAGDQDGSLQLWSLPEGELAACMVDLRAMPPESEGISVETTDEDGNTVNYDLPCGSPLPPGAVCTCNCVSGSSVCSCVGHSSHYWHPD
jgi:WD40 repeat protein